MCRFFSALCAGVATFVLAAASPSYAAIIQVTANGVVDNGTDGAGLFGAVGADLTGQDYSVSFDIDTSKGYITGGVVSYPPVGPRYYSSVLHNAGSAPAIVGDLQIDGEDYRVDGSKSGVNDYEADLHDGLNSLLQDVASPDAELSFYDGFNPIFPESPLDDPGNGVFHDPNLNPASFNFNTYGIPYLLGNFSFQDGSASTNLELDALNISYNVISAGGGPTTFTSAAPEPFTWLLMLIGVGTIGMTLRYVSGRDRLRLG